MVEESLIKLRHIEGGFSMVWIPSLAHFGALILIMACFSPKDILNETSKKFVVF
jgi:hypothetical protein